MNYPFIRDGVGYIFSSHLINYLQNNKNMKIILRELAQRLTGLGFKNYRKKWGGFVVRVWEVPAELMPPAQAGGIEGNVIPIKRF
jgi:hypothetical protein